MRSAPRRWLLALKQWFVRWLLADVHLGRVMFGEHSVTLTDLVTMDTQVPTTAGQLGMDATTGMPMAFIDGDAKELANPVDARKRARVAVVGDVANPAAAAPDPVDGVSLAIGDRVMLANQASAATNGVYVVDVVGTGVNGQWTRATDADDASDFPPGVETYIEEGTINGRTLFQLTTTGAITLGVTALDYVQGGPIVRSDAAGVDVIGSSGAPVNITNTYSAFGVQTGFTDCRDYSDVVWFITLATSGAAARLDVLIQWSEDATNLADQGTEEIADGTATLSSYEAQFDLTGFSAPDQLPAISLPVAGPNVKISIKTDTSTLTAYVRAWRKA